MKKYFFVLGYIQAFIAIGAIPAGLLFLMDTSGAKMGTNPDLLANSPFSTFLIPGLFLFIVNGLGSASGAIFSFRRKSLAGKAAIILGTLMIMWIIIQVYWIGLSSFLQPLFFVIGSIEVSLGWIIFKNINNFNKKEI